MYYNCSLKVDLKTRELFFFMNVFIKNTDTYSFFCRSWIWKEIEYQYCQKVLKIWSTCKHWIWKVIMMYMCVCIFLLLAWFLTHLYLQLSSSHCWIDWFIQEIDLNLWVHLFVAWRVYGHLTYLRIRSLPCLHSCVMLEHWKL